MSRENPDTDEMLKLLRAREKARRALTKQTAVVVDLQRAFEAASKALAEFEAALQQRMMIDAGLIASPTASVDARISELSAKREALDVQYAEMAARNAPPDEIVPVIRQQRSVEAELAVLAAERLNVVTHSLDTPPTSATI
jgi:DNA repair exonuclease SbcCD ATPase subunit